MTPGLEQINESEIIRAKILLNEKNIKSNIYVLDMTL